MEQTVPAKSSISAKAKAMSAVSALDKARPMLVAIGGPRSWDDTKDHWRNKLARTVGLNPRRIRAILSSEPIRLTADEYLQIEQAYSDARASLAALSILAGDAETLADRLAQGSGREALRRGEPADGPERAGAASSVRSR